MDARPLSLIQLSSLADAMAAQANAAKLLAPFAPEASAQHLANARTAHRQIAKLLDAADNAAEAAYLDHQRSIMESGGPDDSSYRRDMIAAGRGHLIGGA
ncbi:MAG: hypothetical protein WA973_06310 [Mesorhizobium sp.]